MYTGKSIAFPMILACWLGLTLVSRAESLPPNSAAAKKTRVLVDRAAVLIAKKGKEAFTEFGRKGSPWLKGDTYVFVLDMKGIELFSGGFPDQAGTDLSRLDDYNGKLIVVEQQKVVRAQGAGWIDYMWPKPGHTNPVQKWSYVKAVVVDGSPAYVGAGFYP